MKAWYPSAFDGLNFKKLERALDVNERGFLNTDDFIALIEKAATKGASTKGIGENERVPTAKSKKPAEKDDGDDAGKPPSRDLFVLPQDRITCNETIRLINEVIVPAESQIGTEPQDMIEGIFRKTQRWRESFPDSEQLEDALADRYTIYKRPGEKIRIHTLKTLMDHMSGLTQTTTRRTLADELGLTKDEVDLICITSLDPEYFPWMLIEQSDFLNWFTTDFSGSGETEKQEKKDFRADKLSDWVEATALAIELVSINPKEHSQIQDMEWWENQRFKNVGEMLLNEFNADKRKYTEMKKLFDEHNDRLSYYDFFHYLEHKLKLNLADWEEDALQGFLDS